MNRYDHKEIEPKWQKIWEDKKAFEASDVSARPKFYGLIEFPYPSGEGMHMGHLRSNTAMDIIARKRRAEGFEVLYPIGWDAFGLPTENYAIKTGKQPSVITKENTDNFRRQLKSAGFSFDWTREVNTTDPEYFKWTQWIFLQFFKQNLAYKKKMAINWCPKDKIGLANEEVINGCCERCGGPVEKREKEQWMLSITKYADRLVKDLDTVNYLENIKTQQRNWIGRSEGTEFEFILKPETEPTFYQFFEPGTIKEGEPFVEREAILAIVKHWSEDKYIGLKWKKVDWDTFITGGVEKGQTPEEAAHAEIQEETGFKNLKLVKKLDKVHSKFFHVPKNQNRFGHFNIFYFELQNGEREDVAEDEKDKHEIVWLTKTEVKQFKLPACHRHVWDMLQNGGKAKAERVKVFTTRADTLFGVAYLVLSPEHPLINQFIHQSSNAVEIDSYIKNAQKKTEIDRTDANKEKTGVELKGVKAINPATGEEVPVWVADYVFGGYGTGAVMAVPAHDDRDLAFAKKYRLPIKNVIAPFFSAKLGEKDAIRPDKKTVKRKTAYALVYNKKTDSYLCLNWEKFNWHSGVIGGVDEGETYEQAAMREIREETGYVNLKFIKNLGVEQNNLFFAAHKDENRHAVGQGMLFELIDEKREVVAAEHTKNHKPVWIKSGEMEKWLNLQAFNYMWSVFVTGSECFVDNGVLCNSGKFDGKSSEEARKDITKAYGEAKVTYKLKDWIFSRQRYWGEPIPLVYCENCAKNGNGWIAVSEKDLPVTLPKVEKYQPTDTGESPLSSIKKWVETKCPACDGPARRETDTMPNWAGSSWYYLRYTDPKNKKQFASTELLKKWTPVDWYNGGMEHVTLHLLYSRFWHKFLFDLGLVPTSEPYAKRTAHGLILASDGEKMSKSRGNVVNPDKFISTFGADALRLYEMFMGPFDQSVSWNDDGVVGTLRFLERVWRLQEKVSTNGADKSAKTNSKVETLLHQTIAKVSNDIEEMHFNTAVSAMMILTNEFEKLKTLDASWYQTLIQLLAPFAPHIAEELWTILKNKGFVHETAWPKSDASKMENNVIVMIVQVNGKVRSQFEANAGISENEAKNKAISDNNVKKYIENKEIKKVIFVPNRLINIVVGD